MVVFAEVGAELSEDESRRESRKNWNSWEHPWLVVAGAAINGWKEMRILAQTAL